MFGHSSDPINRITEHIRTAGAHGWALVDGLLSPGLADARPLERLTLDYTSMPHGGVFHYRERFYNMRFEGALKVALSVMT
ncbi:hypothetical protein [Mycobacteroides abscessus]|uniref:hypothetical protein n=1 Tax=Mycobacteroides abscessus TaxID=36809 RepID=UPI0012FECDB7|nr:hypothetical protein [Mycobacteroides abscessus]